MTDNIVFQALVITDLALLAIWLIRSILSDKKD